MTATTKPNMMTETTTTYVGCDECERGMVRWYEVRDTADGSDGTYAVYAERCRVQDDDRWIALDGGADDITEGHRHAMAADAERMAGRHGVDA